MKGLTPEDLGKQKLHLWVRGAPKVKLSQVTPPEGAEGVRGSTEMCKHAVSFKWNVTPQVAPPPTGPSAVSLVLLELSNMKHLTLTRLVNCERTSYNSLVCFLHLTLAQMRFQVFFVTGFSFFREKNKYREQNVTVAKKPNQWRRSAKGDQRDDYFFDVCIWFFKC